MTEQNHESVVRTISDQVRSRGGRGEPARIRKAAVSHFVPNPREKEDLPRIDMTPLTSILEINESERTCTAESGVTFSELVKATLAKGLVPYTVPELKGITVGGAVSGCSIESMSYRHGGFHDSCLEYEIVTGTGDVATCSPERNPELFHMLHGSYGTLGLITRAKFRLHPAKPYVKMTYERHRSFSEFWRELRNHCNRADHDFIDAIIHSRDSFVICLGDMVESAPYTSNYDWLKIFYKSTAERVEDYLTTYDYFFRYDAECHWLTRTVPLMETMPARLLLGKMLLGSTNLIKWSKRVKPIMKLKRRPEVVVDVFIPSKRFEEFYRWYESDFDFFPLWIVPYRTPQLYPWISDEYAKKIDDTLFIDCAVYGKKNSDPNIDYSELLERKTVELGGLKTLISRNHFDESTFWKVYDKPRYDRIKSQTDPRGVFENLYDKFSPRHY
ncbi:MAG: FAD-binding oxidoreductase [Proteobacteria bacterium]|nr:FAD-binding oxidoreductase [Pseudomonadota bacterium]